MFGLTQFQNIYKPKLLKFVRKRGKLIENGELA
jgi:hypothetical protein